MRRLQRSSRLLALILLLGMATLLVGQPTLVDAQSAECLDSATILCIDPEGDVTVGVPSTTSLSDNEFFTVYIPTAARQQERVHFGNGNQGLWFTNGSQRGFQPFLYGIADDQRVSMYIAGSTTPENDIGRSALVAINGRYHGGASGGVVQTRPIFSVNNYDRPATLMVDHNDRVGIGMQMPNVQLEVQGMIHTNDGFSFASRNDLHTYVADAPNGERWTWTVRSGVARLGPAGNGNRLVVEPGGNIGIGTNNPVAKLDIVDGPQWRAGWRKALRIGQADVVEFVSEGTSYGIGGDNSGRLSFFAADGNSNGETTGSMVLDKNGNFRVSGTTTTSVLQITGGADLAEPFAMTDADRIEPGMVVAIDPDNPGQLRLAENSYDRGVAGIVSGAGGISPGITLQQEGTLAIGDHPVSLSGRVYVWADASYGAIQPTDLLTSSDTPGHAMKVAAYENAHGAIIGKAMTGLEEGRGLVLVLVTLH